MSRSEGRVLAALASTVPPGARVVEYGTEHLKATRWLVEGVVMAGRLPRPEILAVGEWRMTPASLRQYQRSMGRHESMVVPMRKSANLMERLDQIHMMLIGWQSERVLWDVLERWEAKLAPGCVVAAYSGPRGLFEVTDAMAVIGRLCLERGSRFHRYERLAWTRLEPR